MDKKRERDGFEGNGRKLDVVYVVVGFRECLAKVMYQQSTGSRIDTHPGNVSKGNHSDLQVPSCSLSCRRKW